MIGRMEKYEQLAYDLDDGNAGHFLSGWQCINKVSNEFLRAVHQRTNEMDRTKYVYFDEDEILIQSLKSLHEDKDGVRPQEILCGSGATILLYSFVAYLKKLGVEEVLYLPPIYFTLHTALELYGIHSSSVATRYAFEDDFQIELPAKKTVLFLADPIWFAGVPLSKHIINKISEWQRATGSLAFVDGSTQYMKWDGPQNEISANLVPEATFRLISPTKQLASHGYRFSYLIMPSEYGRSLGWTYSNINGPASCDTIAFAHEATKQMRTGTITRALLDNAIAAHKMLRQDGRIYSPIEPICGYFVFEEIHTKLPANYTVMDGSYFDLNRFPSRTKINLLSPSLSLLKNSTTNIRSTT